MPEFIQDGIRDEFFALYFLSGYWTTVFLVKQFYFCSIMNIRMLMFALLFSPLVALSGQPIVVFGLI